MSMEASGSGLHNCCFCGNSCDVFQPTNVITVDSTYTSGFVRGRRRGVGLGAEVLFYLRDLTLWEHVSWLNLIEPLSVITIFLFPFLSFSRFYKNTKAKGGMRWEKSMSSPSTD